MVVEIQGSIIRPAPPVPGPSPPPSLPKKGQKAQTLERVRKKQIYYENTRGVCPHQLPFSGLDIWRTWGALLVNGSGRSQAGKLNVWQSVGFPEGVGVPGGSRGACVHCGDISKWAPFIGRPKTAYKKGVRVAEKRQKRIVRKEKKKVKFWKDLLFCFFRLFFSKRQKTTNSPGPELPKTWVLHCPLKAGRRGARGEIGSFKCHPWGCRRLRSTRPLPTARCCAARREGEARG